MLGSFPLNLFLMMAYPDNPYGDVSMSGASSSGVDRINRMLRLLRLTKLAKLARMFKLAKYLEGAERVINPGVLAVIKLVRVRAGVSFRGSLPPLPPPPSSPPPLGVCHSGDLRAPLLPLV